MISMWYFHMLVMYFSLMLFMIWMVGVCDSLQHGRFFNWLCKKKWMVIPVALLLLIFVARVWYVIAFDIQDIVNYMFGLCGCTPIDLKNFG